jgi:RNA polymerase sigma-70 factor (ECF subfamily)
MTGSGNDFQLDETLRRVRSGDTEAYRRIVREYSLPLRAFLASQLHHLDEVDDLAQECFIAAFEHLERFRTGEDFGAWLRGIARNKLKTHFRSHARRQSAMERFRDELSHIIESDLEHLSAGLRAAQIERLLRCIAELPDRMRRIVRAGLEGQRGAELATELGISPGALYTTHHRANKLLRACMERDDT